MEVKEYKGTVKKVLQKYNNDESLLVDILQDVQSEIGYLPKEVLEETSRGLKIPLSRVYSVATFFKAFSLKPRGRYLINVCLGTACHVRGAGKVAEQIEKELGIKRGETTPDLKFTLETVN
jgi:NADH-quinone oxidoreductase subunit E